MANLRTIALAFTLPAMLLTVAGRAAAAPQDPVTPQPSSVEHVQNTLNRTPPHSLKFDAKVPVPAATYKITVTQPLFVLPIMDTLRKQFELTPLQRQSADWSARCCGVNLVALTESIEKAFRRWEEGRIHDRVSRELAEVEAAALKRSSQDR